MNLIVLIVISVFVGGIIFVAKWLSVTFAMSAWLAFPIATALGVAVWWLIVAFAKVVDVRLQKRRGRSSRP